MSFKITLDTKEIEAISKALKDDASTLKNELLKASTRSALDIQTTAKKPGYVPYDTGTLRRSITNKVKPTGTSILTIIGSNVAYAAIHEFGGQTGRGGSVTIKPKRYIQRAIEDNEEKIRERIKRAVALHLLK